MGRHRSGTSDNVDQCKSKIKISPDMSPSGTPPLELDNPAASPPPDTGACTLGSGGAMTFGSAAACPARAPITNRAATREPVTSRTRAVSEAVWMRPDRRAVAGTTVSRITGGFEP